MNFLKSHKHQTITTIAAIGLHDARPEVGTIEFNPEAFFEPYLLLYSTDPTKTTQKRLFA